MDLVGSVEDSDVIIVDDMIDTGGTLCKAASVIKEYGGEGRESFRHLDVRVRQFFCETRWLVERDSDSGWSGSPG